MGRQFQVRTGQKDCKEGRNDDPIPPSQDNALSLNSHSTNRLKNEAGGRKFRNFEEIEEIIQLRYLERARADDAMRGNKLSAYEASFGEMTQNYEEPVTKTQMLNSGGESSMRINKLLLQEKYEEMEEAISHKSKEAARSCIRGWKFIDKSAYRHSSRSDTDARSGGFKSQMR